MERLSKRSIFALLPACVAAVMAAGCGGSGTRTGVLPTPSAPVTATTTDRTAATVPGACALVTQQDLVRVTEGTVTLQFTGDPVEESDTSLAVGARSTCRQGLKSVWDDGGGTATVDGLVDVEIQADGAKIYFPVTTGDPVSGIGDEAMSRGGTLYVRVGAAVLILDIGIANPSDDQAATQLAWAKQLAAAAVGRVG